MYINLIEAINSSSLLEFKSVVEETQFELTIECYGETYKNNSEDTIGSAEHLKELLKVYPGICYYIGGYNTNVVGEKERGIYIFKLLNYHEALDIYRQLKMSKIDVTTLSQDDMNSISFIYDSNHNAVDRDEIISRIERFIEKEKRC